LIVPTTPAVVGSVALVESGVVPVYITIAAFALIVATANITAVFVNNVLRIIFALPKLINVVLLFAGSKPDTQQSTFSRSSNILAQTPGSMRTVLGQASAV